MSGYNIIYTVCTGSALGPWLSAGGHRELLLQTWCHHCFLLSTISTYKHLLSEMFFEMFCYKYQAALALLIL